MKHNLQYDNWQWLLLSAYFCLAIQFLFPQSAIVEKLLAEAKNNQIVAGQMQLNEANGAELSDLIFGLPSTNDRVARYRLRVPVTAYSSTVDQTDITPFITASGTTVRPGVVAANFLPIGTRLRLPDYFGNQIFVVEDRMHHRFSKRLDIWMESRDQAVNWGIRHLNVEVL